MPDRMPGFLAALLLFLALLSLAGCFGGEKTKRGFNYMPDMYDSPAPQAQQAMRIEERDEQGNLIRIREVSGALPPPPGSVSRNLHYSPTSGSWIDEEHARYANPLPRTTDTLVLGRIKYDAYCAVCHGRDGNVANNYLGDKFAGIISLNIDAVEEMTDGHIFDVITHGVRRMPGYKAQLMPDERWAVIHYMRVLQAATKLDDDTRQRLLNDERAGVFDAFTLPPTPVPEHERGRWPEFNRE